MLSQPTTTPFFLLLLFFLHFLQTIIHQQKQISPIMSNRSKKTQIPTPKCPICHTPFNDQINTPLLLHCGHTFCHQCLSKILSSTSSSTTPPTISNNPHSKSKPYLSCPKCRHVSPLGNSLLSLPKNFTLLLSLSDLTLSSDSDSDDDADDGRNDDDHDDDEEEIMDRGGGGGGSQSSFCCLRGGSGLVDHELRVEKEKGMGVLVKGRGRGKCRHRVVVRRVESGDVAEIDWVEKELESLRRRSMWCRNVCGFYGVVKREDHLCIVSERCFGCVDSEMRRSGGRLTLDQILRLLFH